MKANDYIEMTEEYMLRTYNRFPIVLDHGKGCRLYDCEGREYLDFGAGIAVFALGYGHTLYNRKLKEQVDRLIHTSNLFYHPPGGVAAKKLVEASEMSKVFFTNSGAEAIEGAIKSAKKYACLRDGHTDHEIIAMNCSFHGRTLGALSVTGNKAYREAFGPMIEGIRFADFNDIESVKAQITDKTCAIILEPVQGEGGIYPAGAEFLEEIRKICDQKDILLIFDEIQCGMGRCKEMFAWMGYGVKPDIMTTAKALGCGIPVGAFLLNEKVANASLTLGDHGTTYGGNPLACAAVEAVFSAFEEEDILNHVRQISPLLEQALDCLADRFSFIKERRGLGLMQGLCIDTDKVKISDIILSAQKEGLIILSAGKNVLRFVPPLVITKVDILEMTRKMERVLEQYEG